MFSGATPELAPYQEEPKQLPSGGLGKDAFLRLGFERRGDKTALIDFFIYVIDVAAGDKIPRKNGPGISQSDILVINKIDLAPYVDADLDVMDRDSKLMRGRKPFVFTNCKTNEGIPELVSLIRENVLFDLHAASSA